MPAQLLALNDGPSILLDKPILLLGRDLECDIRLDSRKISRRHCCIAQVGVQLVVRDLGSTNGVRINGVRVVEGYLKVGDEFTIGNFRYQVRWDSVAVAPGLEKAEKQLGRHLSTDKPPAEDDILEECEEPVPLSDPPPGGEQPEAPVKAPVASVPPAASAPPAPIPRNPQTQILPDEEQMELAPPSDVKAPRPPEAPEQKPA